MKEYVLLVNFIRDINWDDIPEDAQIMSESLLLNGMGAIISETIGEISKISLKIASTAMKSEQATTFVFCESLL